MDWNEPQYGQAQQHPDEIPLSSSHKQPRTTIAPVEQNWTPQDHVRTTSPSRPFMTLLREWQWELATWLLGSCALATVVGLLIYFQDSSLKEWELEISMATTVAALSQVAQSALIFAVSSCIGQLKWDWLRKKRSASDLDRFEEASRGPKGSFLLIFKTGLHLVSIGAFATVLMLAFAPFTQQSNTIAVRNVDSTSAKFPATISRSVQYLNFNWDQSLLPRDEPEYFNTTKLAISNFHPHMYKGVISGVLDENMNISDVKGNCTAEACRWEGYTTLALCAAVEDISLNVQLRKDAKGYNRFRISDAPWDPPAQPSTTSPDTFWMTAPPAYKDLPEIQDGKLSPVSNIYVAYFPSCNKDDKSWGDSSQWQIERDNASNWRAFKGTLDICLQTLDSIYNNTMATTIVDTPKDLKWELSGNDGTGTGRFCTSYKGENFCVGASDITQWTASIQKTVEGAAILQAGGDNYYTGAWMPELVGDILGPIPASCDPDLGPGYGFEGFTSRVKNIAIAMSNALRIGNITSPDSIVVGTELSSEQYFVVEFYWLSLPAAIWLMITIFLIMTIAKSRKEEVPMWKSSPLVLFHVAERNNGMQYLGQVDKEARKTQLQLRYTGENWYLQDVTVIQYTITFSLFLSALGIFFCAIQTQVAKDPKAARLAAAFRSLVFDSYLATYSAYITGLRKPVDQPDLDTLENFEIRTQMWFDELARIEARRRNLLVHEAEEWLYKHFGGTTDVSKAIKGDKCKSPVPARGVWRLLADGKVERQRLDDSPLDWANELLGWDTKFAVLEEYKARLSMKKEKDEDDKEYVAWDEVCAPLSLDDPDDREFMKEDG